MLGAEEMGRTLMNGQRDRQNDEEKGTEKERGARHWKGEGKRQIARGEETQRKRGKKTERK